MSQQHQAPQPGNGQLPALGANDLETLYGCLQGALSHDPATQRKAEAALAGLEPRSGFCSCLCEVIAVRQVEFSARWLAAVHLKNSISKCWRLRAGAQGALSTEEKQHLREKLLQLVGQEDSKIAVQIAVVFAKVARSDYPQAWPGLFTDLLARLQGQEALTVRRVYLVLHHILKELASKRLAADQRNFAAVTAQLYDHLWGRWCGDTGALVAGLPEALQQGPQGQQPLLPTFERWLIVLKALRRLFLFGFQSDAQSLQQVPVVSKALPVLVQALQALLPLHPDLPPARTQLPAMLDRGILKLSKTIANIQDTHPWSTYQCGMLQPTLEFFTGQLLQAHDRAGGLFERFLITAMLYLHAVLKSRAYRGTPGALGLTAAAKQHSQAAKAAAAQVQADLAAFWHQERLVALGTALVQRFLPLTAADLEEWEESPELFHHRGSVGGCREHPRTAAEALLLALLEHSRPALAPALLSMLQAATQACPPGAASAAGPPLVHRIPAALLAKEAVYNAVGVGAFELHDALDFGPWFRGMLLPELADGSPAAAPLRRRVALLLGRWVQDLAEADRPAAYRALLALLAAQGDPALQLAAVDALHALIDDFGFREEPFMGFVGPSFQLLAAFLQSATEFDSQIQAFNLINIIIDRLGDEVVPYAEGLLQLLPPVWEQAQGQSLLRIQVLLALQRLVNALGPASPAAYPFLAPVLAYCTDIGQPEELNLLEDGLATWLTALRNAPAARPDLLALFPNLAAVMQRSTEHIPVAARIMVSCILLGGADFLRHYGASLTAILAGLLGNVKERASLLLFPVLDTALQAYPADAPALLQPALLRLLAVVLSGQETALVTAVAMSVFARILLQNPTFFLHFLSAAAAAVPLPAGAAQNGGGDAAQQLLLALLDLWLERFDSIAAPPARKLSALALAAALALPLPPLLDRLDLIAANVTAVWFEVEGQGNGSVHHGYDHYNSALQGPSDDADGAVVSSEDAEGESSRRRQLFANDPVNNLRLSSFLKDKLNECAALHGQRFHAAFAALDPSVAQQLKAAAGW